MPDIDEIALETVKAIGSVDPDKLPGGKTQAIAQAQILVRDAIESQITTTQSEIEALCQQLEQAQARVAELEADQQYAKGTLLCPKWAKAQLLREKAEAVDECLHLAKQPEAELQMRNYVSGLRQQADQLDAEQSGGNQCQ